MIWPAGIISSDDILIWIQAKNILHLINYINENCHVDGGNTVNHDKLNI